MLKISMSIVEASERISKYRLEKIYEMFEEVGSVEILEKCINDPLLDEIRKAGERKRK